MAADLVGAISQLLMQGATGRLRGKRLGGERQREQQLAADALAMQRRVQGTKLRMGAKTPEQLAEMDALVKELGVRTGGRQAMLPGSTAVDIMPPPGPSTPSTIEPVGTGIERFPVRGAESDAYTAGAGGPQTAWQPQQFIPNPEHVAPAQDDDLYRMSFAETAPPDPLSASLWRNIEAERAELARKGGLQERRVETGEGGLEHRQAELETRVQHGYWPKKSPRRGGGLQINLGASPRTRSLERQRDEQLADAATGVPGAAERAAAIQAKIEAISKTPLRGRVPTAQAAEVMGSRAGRIKAERAAKAVKADAARMKLDDTERAGLKQLDDAAKALERQRSTRHKKYGAKTDEQKLLDERIAAAWKAKADAVVQLQLRRVLGARPAIEKIKERLPDIRDDQVGRAVKLLNRALGGAYRVKAEGRAGLVQEIERILALLPQE